ncbi:TRAPP trafficking subunit Trs65-domain-containing protein [Boletus reticuloceps]|uniref:TRAPP trafficking subunit Trs65-domain-containing protein n=1 Tax=Boletus reticuloceps TaxID=495285 RepID=A0A8I2YNP4_9AGAM|nr:TRAPP trafficking subunit Trs65-domain-containing protein [Boletus reticuloceps]
MASGESLDTIFGSCALEVYTPDTSISFPEHAVDIDEWFASVKQPHAERKQAFFDEQLNLLLVMYIKHPSLNNTHDCHNPPRSLVDLLSHVQVSLEATYVSRTPNQDVPDTAGLVPPRTSSMATKSANPRCIPRYFHPTLRIRFRQLLKVTANTCNQRELFSFPVSGGRRKQQTDQRRSLHSCFLRPKKVGLLSITFVHPYLRIPFSDPLLCLTASATLRDMALCLSQSSHPFVAYLKRTGMISHLESGAMTGGEDTEEDEEEQDTGFEEINLFDGLTLAAPSPFNSTRKYLSSTTLFASSHIRTDWGPSFGLQTDSKSYPAKILPQSSANGLWVSCPNAYCICSPCLAADESSCFQSDQGADDRDDFDSGNEEREAGNSERTVVLCVEVENSGDSGPAMGFSLERLDVKIGGEGATARLIGWGESAFDSDIENRLFPLLIGSMEQYNLLYVVSFWGTPNDQENLLLTGRGINDGSELQRAVTITVYGRPYLTNEAKDENNNILSYPTRTFSSRWNCILDLSSRLREEPVDFHENSVGRSALPEPASPFPGRTAFSSLFASRTPTPPTPQAIAGKRHTLPGSITAMRAINPSASFRLSLPREYPGGSGTLLAPATGYTPPSVALQAFNRSVPTTFGTSMPEMPAQPFVTPPTPSYPAFSPSMTMNTPHIQALGSQQGYSGPSVEVKRERGMGLTSTVPQTPLPTVFRTQFDGRRDPLSVPSGEPIVVSVGLLPSESDNGICSVGQRKIYPSEQFTLDIFVYNQSSWTRRFEVSYPDANRRHRKTGQNKPTSGSKGKGVLEEFKASIAPPGILPLQNRVRVGPLKPSTCQSVRMDFLAISPGMHSVDILTLTDIETGYAVNLRSVMDIVVHERTIEEKEKVP